MIKSTDIVDIKYLKTFHKVSECKSFSDAAESLFLTQPAVSQHIKKIENSIGFPVLERGREIKLTKEGKVLLKYTKKSIELHKRLLYELSNDSSNQHYKIAISNKFCIKVAGALYNLLIDIVDKNLIITHFDEESEININEYDIVLGLLNAPDKGGCLVKAEDPRYSLFFSFDKDSKPKKVVHSTELSYLKAKQLIEFNGIDTSQITSWIGADTSLYMHQQAKSDDTLVICPCWSICDSPYNKIATQECINCYAWCSDYLVELLQEKNLDDELRKMLIKMTSHSCCIKHR
ncbi:LysR family transcriptional regulator [Vibrio sp. JC009]|uniref:LysR family transcriptional regulator n=1 Tax=Vibrio sp. JC009 TaxID=2912314 RepID=UPI0023AEB326|nr:LysR family transcriptional regulator [Vibrio sp. JC009]WED24562.1 LysR family transcriptional regulator [Vibrio sp. JC009]